MFANKTHEEGHALLSEGNILEAIKAFTKALEQNPDHPDIYSDRGVAHLHNMDKANCFDDLNQALTLQPQYSFRYSARAYAKRNFGDLIGAIKDYEKAVDLDPDDAVAQNNLGLLLEQQGYQKQADERFKRADNLSKMEDHLYEVIDDLEEPNQTKDDKIEEPAVNERLEIDPNLERNKSLGTASQIKQIFTSRKQFGEFIRFIKNGFKIK